MRSPIAELAQFNLMQTEPVEPHLIPSFKNRFFRIIKPQPTEVYEKIFRKNIVILQMDCYKQLQKASPECSSEIPLPQDQ